MGHDEPVRVRPRLDAKPWGGRRLAQWGIALSHEEAIGEALLTAPHAVVVDGPLPGAALAELVAAAPERWIGERGLAATGGRPIFPLLIKLIDARENLSIQVHPDDRQAAARGLGTGKTEAHHVLAADAGSRLYLGLREPAGDAPFARACLSGDGSAAEHLRAIPATPGLTLVVPAGTVHAIGGGVLLYEIQQPSNVTFRLDDWGRRDENGRPRELHHDDGLAVLDRRSQPDPILPIPLLTGPVRRELIAATPYFALERISAATGERVEVDGVASPQALTAIAGDAWLARGQTRTPLTAGETAILPAGVAATLTAQRDATILRGWVPDLEREVRAPARRAGATEAAIATLAGGAR